jgi:dipeptidase
MDYSDSYLNEYGVCIASNSCPSREDKPAITDGGIGYNLRQLMAERAATARDAVVLAGQLIEQFGYNASGRTYSIADPHEAWALAVVKGKHWIAQRIPDDQIMVIPNNFTIQEIDLTDGRNFLGSSDLISYAISRGWYNPATDGAFNFRKVYAAKNSITNPGNVNRAWGAYHLLKTGYQITADFPFSFKPSAPVSKQDLMQLLRYHYEGTELDKSEGFTKGSPYKMNGTMICGIASVYGFIAEMRDWMPVDIGCLLWLAPQWPDIQPFLPIYAGTTGFPREFYRADYLKSLNDHYNPPADIHERNDQHAFWAYVRFSEVMDNNYGKLIPPVKKKMDKLETRLIADQPRLEKKLIEIYKDSPEVCHEIMTRLYSKYSLRSLSLTKKLTKSLI